MDQLLDYAFGPRTTGSYSMIAPPVTRETATRTFPLLKLPPELRAIVFEPLIQAGDLSILRVSKLFNQEAVSLLSKVAILRISPNKRINRQITIALTAKITLYGHLTLSAPDYIQNLDICLDLVPHPWRPLNTTNTKVIQYFTGKRIARRSCNITLLFGFLVPVSMPLEEEPAFRVIAGLTGFKSLTLKLEYEIYTKLNDPDLIHYSLLRDYKRVSDLLAISLGPYKLIDGPEEHGLSFRPGAFKPRLSSLVQDLGAQL